MSPADKCLISRQIVFPKLFFGDLGVALETVQVLENQMLMRQYKGFLE